MGKKITIDFKNFKKIGQKINIFLHEFPDKFKTANQKQKIAYICIGMGIVLVLFGLLRLMF